MSPPDRSYLVCATPRSGSSLLCGLLKSTGLAGNAEEYFWRDDEPFWTRRWGTSGFAAYLRAALDRTSTGNGVFAAKVMWGYADELFDKLRGLPGNADRTDGDCLHRAFPRLRLVHLTRTDVVAQAVSWARAAQTDQWYVAGAERDRHRPQFDADQIDALVRLIGEHEAAWDCWFAAHDFRPHLVRYEDLLADPAGAVRGVLDFLEIAYPPDLAVTPQTERQGDDLNAEWVRRYLASSR